MLKEKKRKSRKTICLSVGSLMASSPLTNPWDSIRARIPIIIIITTSSLTSSLGFLAGRTNPLTQARQANFGTKRLCQDKPREYIEENANRKYCIIYISGPLREMIAHNIGVTGERTLPSDPISPISIDQPSYSRWVEKVPSSWGNTALRLIRLILYIFDVSTQEIQYLKMERKREKKRGLRFIPQCQREACANFS